MVIINISFVLMLDIPLCYHIIITQTTSQCNWLSYVQYLPTW